MPRQGLFEQRLQQVHAGDADGAEERVGRGVRAGERAGMGGGELCGGLGAAELVGDDGLAGGVRLAGGFLEPIRAADGFEEQQGGVGVGVVDQQGGDLAGGEVGLVAGAARLGLRSK